MNRTSYDRAILNAIPLAIFVVDEDVRIRDWNTAALEMFGIDGGAVLNQRGGDALHCINAQNAPSGCGSGPVCQSCVIRGAVQTCLQGKSVNRRRMRAELAIGERTKPLDLLITASPMPQGNGESLALLILEDITELSKLRGIIPICANCKQIRDDRQYWQSVESYFATHIGADFSHSLCPSCVKTLYPEY